MIKLKLLSLSLLIVQFCYSEPDSTKYPIIIDSGQIVKKTIVAFTPEQAKQIAIEGVQLDGCLVNQVIDSAIIANRNQMINEKNLQIKNTERSLVLKDKIIEEANKNPNINLNSKVAMLHTFKEQSHQSHKCQIDCTNHD